MTSALGDGGRECGGPLRVLRLCSVFEVPDGSPVDPRFDPVGGMQSHTARLTRALDRRGVVQHIITSWRPGLPSYHRVADHAMVHRVGFRLRRFRQGYALPAARAVRRMAGAVDLVHAHLGEDLAVVGLAALARRGGVPVVLTVHCSPARTMMATGPRSAAVKALGGRLERWAGKRAGAVITLTRGAAAAAVASGVPSGRVHVIPSGVEASPARSPVDPVPAARHPRLVFAGRLVAQKDPLAVIDALAAMSCPASLVVLGDGPLLPAMRRRAGALRLSDAVHFLGFVPASDVGSHFAHADLLVLPSLYEELGSVLVEAMSAGLPVVATHVGGVPEVVADSVTGLLVPPGDRGALAHAADRLLADPVRRARMSAAARARAPGYDWDVLASRVADVYAAVRGPSRRVAAMTAS